MPICSRFMHARKHVLEQLQFVVHSDGFLNMIELCGRYDFMFHASQQRH